MYYGEVRIPNKDLDPLLRTAASLKIKGLSAHYRSETRSATQPDFPQNTPLKKRRISSDVDEHQVTPSRCITVRERPEPEQAFSHDDSSNLRISSQASQPFHPIRTPNRTDSGRISPVRVQSPSRILRENRTQQIIQGARHLDRGKK